MRIDAVNERTRPMRSARIPNRIPPAAEEKSVSEFRSPAVVLVMPSSVMSCARTIEYNMTSIASSIQPSPPAISDFRWAVDSREGIDKPRNSRLMAWFSARMIDIPTLWVNRCDLVSLNLQRRSTAARNVAGQHSGVDQKYMAIEPNTDFASLLWCVADNESRDREGREQLFDLRRAFFVRPVRISPEPERTIGVNR